MADVGDKFQRETKYVPDKMAGGGLGLGTCQIGALFDDEVSKILDIDGTEETVVYMSVAGAPA